MTQLCRRAAATLLAAPLALGGAPAVLADESDGVLSLVIENDSFDGGDGHYTNGFELRWVGGPGAAAELPQRLASWFPLWPEAAAVRPTLSFGQKIFTPCDTSFSMTQPGDRPYAGFLFLSGGLVAETEGQVDQLELTLGLVGPAALGEEVQKLAHDIAGFDSPSGWDGQIQNEAAVMLTYQRSWPGLLSAELLGVGVDLTPHAGAALGNVYTYANAGAMLRLGFGLAGDQGAPRMRPGGAETGVFDGDGLSAYLFAGVDGRAVAQNIFLDGNTFHDGPRVDKAPFVGDLQLGAAVSIENVRLSYTHVLRSREFEHQDENDTYGSVSLSVRF